MEIMYYVIETNYVGPNQTQDQYVDVDRIDISTSPALLRAVGRDSQSWLRRSD